WATAPRFAQRRTCGVHRGRSTVPAPGELADEPSQRRIRIEPAQGTRLAAGVLQRTLLVVVGQLGERLLDDVARDPPLREGSGERDPPLPLAFDAGRHQQRRKRAVIQVPAMEELIDDLLDRVAVDVLRAQDRTGFGDRQLLGPQLAHERFFGLSPSLLDVGGSRHARRRGVRVGDRREVRRSVGQRGAPEPIRTGPARDVGVLGRLVPGRASAEEGDDGGEVLLAPVQVGHDQAGRRSASWATGASSPAFMPMPSFCLIWVSIASAMSSFLIRKLRAFSLPWPSWSPSYVYQEPDFFTIPCSTPKSIRLPSREIPTP